VLRYLQSVSAEAALKVFFNRKGYKVVVKDEELKHSHIDLCVPKDG